MTDWAQRIMPSRPRKLLVYLDQNFISEMAKPGHSGVRPDFRELYSVLHKGFWNEQLVVLRSRFHDLETRLAGALKDAIRARRSTLGHVDLVSQWDIRESQIVASLHKFLGQDDGSPVVNYEDAFEEEPDDRVGHLDINVNMDWMHTDAKEQRHRLAAELDTVRQRILDHSISYEQQFRIEMDAPAKRRCGRTTSGTMQLLLVSPTKSTGGLWPQPPSRTCPLYGSMLRYLLG